MESVGIFVLADMIIADVELMHLLMQFNKHLKSNVLSVSPLRVACPEGLA